MNFLARILGKSKASADRNKPIKLAINLNPTQESWGGGNQFVLQLKSFLEAKEWKVVHRLESDVDLILMIDPRKDKLVQFDDRDIEKFKRKHPHVRCLHRINECDQRKNSNFMDDLLRKANRVADHTVFISHWLEGYFLERGFDSTRPRTVIQNGASDAVFYPPSARNPSHAPFRLVTHHWSNNVLKGFDVYEEIDELIASGKLPDFSLTVIGRWPESIRWKSAILHPPCNGPALAELLRQHDLYVTASRWEPCGMHHIEGAQCGLPLVYHEDGGGIVEFGERYGIPFSDDVRSALQIAKVRYPELRAKVRAAPPSGQAMSENFYTTLLAMLVR